MAEYMGKVVEVHHDGTFEVAVYSGGFKTNTRRNAHDGSTYKVLRKNKLGRPTRRVTGMLLQFEQADVRGGEAPRRGQTVMVEMQPVPKPVRRI